MNRKKLYGRQPANVIDVLKKRTANYTPQANNDGFKLGLVVEGGGMRGVQSCAAVDALWQLGYGSCFDNLYGTSAGAINCAYFMSGQITLGTSIYYENLIGNRFINVFRWPDPMDIHYLFDDWITGGKPLDVEVVLNSKTKLVITTTDCESGKPYNFSNRDIDKDTLIQALRASSSTPMFTTNKEKINGHILNDGIVNDGIPLREAINDECTHIVCVLTREVGYRKKATKIMSFLENLRFRRYAKEYKRAFDARLEKYNQTLDFIYAPNEGSPAILAITMEPGDFMVGNGETNQNKLMRVARESLERTALTLDETDKQLKLLRD